MFLGGDKAIQKGDSERRGGGGRLGEYLLSGEAAAPGGALGIVLGGKKKRPKLQTCQEDVLYNLELCAESCAGRQPGRN